MTDTRYFLLAMAAVLPLALGACSDSPDKDPLIALRDQVSALEQDHHDRALRLSVPAAIRDETEQYARAMHDVLQDMQDACDDMDHGDTMMGGHSGDAMRDAMHWMDEMVEEHRRRVGDMDDLDAMREECGEHHRLMKGGMEDLDAALAGNMGMHGSR